MNKYKPTNCIPDRDYIKRIKINSVFQNIKKQ